MKLRALVALIALALAGASLAYAAPKAVNKKPPKPNPNASTHTSTNSKKPPTTGPGCKPKVVVILKGTFDGTTLVNTDTYLMVHVNGGNKFAKPYRYKVTNADTNVLVTDATKYKGPGHHSLDKLNTNDRLVIRAPACKADVKGQTPPLTTLTATRVLAHTPKAKS